LTTGTARRLAAVMRSLHFIPIKSKRLMPGGRAGKAEHKAVGARSAIRNLIYQ
jgi:hypothetical protein